MYGTTVKYYDVYSSSIWSSGSCALRSSAVRILTSHCSDCSPLGAGEVSTLLRVLTAAHWGSAGAARSSFSSALSHFLHSEQGLRERASAFPCRAPWRCWMLVFEVIHHILQPPCRLALGVVIPLLCQGWAVIYHDFFLALVYLWQHRTYPLVAGISVQDERDLIGWIGKHRSGRQFGLQELERTLPCFRPHKLSTFLSQLVQRLGDTSKPPHEPAVIWAEPKECSYLCCRDRWRPITYCCDLCRVSWDAVAADYVTEKVHAALEQVALSGAQLQACCTESG